MRAPSLKRIIIITVCLILSYPAALFAADTYEELNARIKDASLVIQEFSKSPDVSAPKDLLKNAAAVAVFPSVYKGAFIIGAQYGQGVVCSYNKQTGQWSAPAFFGIGGGSVGFQIGGEAVDLILVITNQRGLQSLLKGKTTLGADVSVAAGPVGREARAETDVLLKAEILSYSRAKGFFAGISLKGAVISANNEANNVFYGKPLFAQEILLEQRVGPKGAGIDLINALEHFSGK